MPVYAFLIRTVVALFFLRSKNSSILKLMILIFPAKEVHYRKKIVMYKTSEFENVTCLTILLILAHTGSVGSVTYSGFDMESFRHSVFS